MSICKIKLTINCAKTTCGDCQYLKIFQTGILGEFHPHCVIFDKNGKWGEHDMCRSFECKRAEIKNNKKELKKDLKK